VASQRSPDTVTGLGRGSTERHREMRGKGSRNRRTEDGKEMGRTRKGKGNGEKERGEKYKTAVYEPQLI